MPSGGKDREAAEAEIGLIPPFLAVQAPEKTDSMETVVYREMMYINALGHVPNY